MNDSSTSTLPYTTLSVGIGSIQADNTQQDRLDEFTNRVGSGEYHVATSGTIPAKCIDGRLCLENHALQPNAAGGTETLMVADDVTDKRFLADRTTRGQYEAVIRYLAPEYAVGGHTATDLHGAPSGCGANDKLKDIYLFLTTHRTDIRAIAENLGVIVDDTTFDHIIKNADERTDFSSGDSLLEVLKNEGTDESVDTLKGAHKEVIAVINMRPNTTLDRNAVENEFGENYQAFNIDVWSFEAGARAISNDQSDKSITQKVAAMVFYNLATACVLCGPAMRVVVLR